MKAQAPTPPAKKGIIVCDTSAMLSLMAPLPLEAIAPSRYPLPTVFDGLLFLAQHGYEVIIPEMVAYEMGDHMRDGESAQKYFAESTSPKITQALAHRSFFRDVVRSESKGSPIHIQPPLPDDTSTEAAFLNTIYRIHTSDMRDSNKRAALCDLGHLPRGWHTASKQIQNYIQHVPPGDMPIYILSNNLHLQQSFAGRSDVNALGATAFYNALKREGFLERLGIQPDGLHFDQNCHRHYKQFNISVNNNDYTYTDAPSGYHFNVPETPFAAAMKELAKDITAQAPAVVDQPALTVEGGGEVSKAMDSQVAKFNARFRKK